MRVANSGFILSATDLSNYLACEHRTALDLAAAVGTVSTPESRLDSALKLLRARGATHERAYIDYLRSQGLNVFEIPSDETPESRVSLTLNALKSGVDAIYQGAFAGPGWIGYADLLRKVLSPENSAKSAFGGFHYEPYDMKLARETRGATILQLSLYAELLGNAQGRPPDRFFVVTPGDPFMVHEYRLADYQAYFRAVRRGLSTRSNRPDHRRKAWQERR
jgi:predicted RecB family nuclease